MNKLVVAIFLLAMNSMVVADAIPPELVSSMKIFQIEEACC